MVTTYLLISLWVQILATDGSELEGGGGQHSTPQGYESEGDLMDKNKKYLKMKNTLPTAGGLPVSIQVHLSLESIRDVAGEATIDLYMTETWIDLRETFNSLSTAASLNDSSYPYSSTTSAESKVKFHSESEIRMSGPGVVNYCWIPDTYFILARSIFYSPTSLSLSVKSSGEVILDRKVRLVTPCKPQVRYFPFDVTTCRILISSYGFDATELYLVWQRNEDGEGVSFPFQYEPLSEMGFQILNMNSTCFYATYSGYTFTILEGVVYLERLYTVYIYQIYIPAALLVVLSWVTFWINKGATPARASVGVTTVLTMLTLATQSQQNMEKHITLETSLLDIYIWVCFSFVIAAMLEFAMSDFLNDQSTRKSKEAIRKDRKLEAKNSHLNPQPGKSGVLLLQNKTNGANGSETLAANSSNVNANCSLLPRANQSVLPGVKTLKREKKRGKVNGMLTQLDAAARVFFPTVFILFNIFYWSYVAYILMNSSYGESTIGNVVPCDSQ